MVVPDPGERFPSANRAARSDGLSADPDIGSGSRAFHAGLRTLRNSIISLAIFFALVIALLFSVPGLRSAAERITDASPLWVAVSIGLEVLSCAGYVVLFELAFGGLGRMGRKLALAELAVNTVISVSGLGGIALGAWVLRSRGLSVQRIARRSVLMFVLSSAVNVIAVVLIGFAMGFGLLSGSEDPLLTFLPAGIALAVIVVTLALALLADRITRHSQSQASRWWSAFMALNAGVIDTVQVVRSGDRRLLGPVAYWLFDNLCLFTCFLAFGHVPALSAILMAYLVGMMANSVPIPGGFGAVEGGLVGMLLLYGQHPASVVLAAVITYRAISLWLPSMLGGAAFLSLRGEIGKPLSADTVPR